MPFTEPWRYPEKGDLAYGVNKNTIHSTGIDRSTFVKDYIKGGTFIGTIDQMRVLDIDKAKPGLRGETGLRKVLEEHDKYKSALDAAGSNQDVTRKCKGGLYWATMVACRHVHFILDGVDIEAVVHKATKGPNPDRDADMARGTTKNRNITGSELRWIYRNRELAGVQLYVQFWFNGEQCPPPWVSYSVVLPSEGRRAEPRIDKRAGGDLWSQYKPKAKHVGQDDVTRRNLDPASMTTDEPGCHVIK